MPSLSELWFRMLDWIIMATTDPKTPLAARWSETGFTLLELLVVLTIIGFFIMALASRLADVTTQAGVTTALEEMNNIKQAVVDLFYPNLGFIPEDPGPDGRLAVRPGDSTGDDDRPWFATRYLCLGDDRERTNLSPDPFKAPQSYAMWIYLRSQINRQSPDDGNTRALALAKLSWDRYRQKGWQGPYMEQDAIVQLDPADTVSMPLIATPWANTCENMAREAEEAGETAQAERLRRGKYYLIVTDTVMDDDGNLHADKNTARIISFGPDCEDSGSYQYPDRSTRVTAAQLRKVNVVDPGNDNAYYSGDDIVMFIFGGGTTRQPAE